MLKALASLEKLGAQKSKACGGQAHLRLRQVPRIAFSSREQTLISASKLIERELPMRHNCYWSRYAPPRCPSRNSSLLATCTSSSLARACEVQQHFRLKGETTALRINSHKAIYDISSPSSLSHHFTASIEPHIAHQESPQDWQHHIHAQLINHLHHHDRHDRIELRTSSNAYTKVHKSYWKA